MGRRCEMQPSGIYATARAHGCFVYIFTVHPKGWLALLQQRKSSRPNQLFSL